MKIQDVVLVAIFCTAATPLHAQQVMPKIFIEANRVFSTVRAGGKGNGMLARADAEVMFEFSLRRMQKENAPADGDTKINCKVLSKNPVVIATGEK